MAAVGFDSGSVLLLCFVSLILLLSGRVISEPTQDKQALLAFLNLTRHANRVQWNPSVSACNWVGVECDPNRSFVYSVRLPGVGLVGAIPPNTLGRLSQLRVLSLRANRLTGEIPSDFSSLTLLRSLYVQNNELTGEFPAGLTRLTRLTRLDLSSNNFTGPIPFSITNLTHLTGLLLENNNFSGMLPIITAPLVNFNVSYNKLNGSIPQTLSKFDASAFAGNLDLCGKPLSTLCSPFFPSPAPSPNPEIPAQNPVHKKSKLSKAAKIAIGVAAGLLALILLLILFLCLKKRHRRRQTAKPPKPPSSTSRTVAAEAGTSSSKEDITGGSIEAERNKLVFFEGGVYSFDLEDLLRASAEVLGKGSVGTSYKAVLEEGTTVVVKRLKDVVVSKREFDMQMEVLGKIKHQNVVPLRAFYYSKDEKLLVYDFMAAGSLSALLHGIVSIFLLQFAVMEMVIFRV